MFNDVITVKDNLNVKDNNRMPLKGKIIIRDKKTNDIIVEKNNLVLLRTRIFVLNMLFNGEVDEESLGYINNPNRKICLMKIGNGGADINSTPVQPFVPKSIDEDLMSPIPFVITTPDKNIDPDYEANPSIYEKLTRKQKELYHSLNEKPDGSVAYYSKEYDQGSFKYCVNKENNESYAHMTFSIAPNEARGYELNELGLCLAEKVYYQCDSKYDYAKDESDKNIFITEKQYEELDDVSKKNYIKGYTDIELATRVTFENIPMRSLVNGLIIEYLFYVG